MAINYWATFYDPTSTTPLFTVNEFVADSLQFDENVNEISSGSIQLPAELADALDIVVGQKMFLETHERMFFIRNITYSANNRITTLELEDEVAEWAWTDAGNNQFYFGNPVQTIATIIDHNINTNAIFYWDLETNSFDHMDAILEGGSVLDNVLSIAKFLRVYFSIIRSYNPRTGVKGLIKLGSFVETVYNKVVYGEAFYGTSIYGGSAQVDLSKYVASTGIVFQENEETYVGFLDSPSYDPAGTIAHGIGRPDASNKYGYGITTLVTAEAFNLYSDDLSANPQVAIIDTIEATSSGTEAFNRLVIEGGGIFPLKNAANENLLSQIPDTLGKVVEGPLNLGHIFANVNGPGSGGYYKFFPQYDAEKRYWYIHHPDSTLPQTRVKRVKYQDVVPVSSSTQDIASAAMVLYRIGSYLLEKFKNPTETYRVTINGRPDTLKCGSIVRIQYKGEVLTSYGAIAFKNIDRFFYIVGMSIKINAAGVPQTTLTISNTGEEKIDVASVVVSMSDEIRKLKYTLQPSLTYKDWSAPTQFITGTSSTGNKFEYYFKMDDSVAAIHDFTAEIYIERIRQTNINLSEDLFVDSGGGVNSDTAIPDHPAITYKVKFTPDFYWEHVHATTPKGIFGAEVLPGNFKYLYIADPPKTNSVFNGEYSTLLVHLADGVNRNDAGKYGLISSFPLQPKNGQETYALPAEGSATITVSEKIADQPAAVLRHPLKIDAHQHALGGEASLVQTIKDDDPANMATGIVCQFNNMNVPLVKEYEGSTLLRDVYRPNLTDLMPADYKGRWMKLTIFCANGRASVTANLSARLSIIPIRA